MNNYNAIEILDNKDRILDELESYIKEHPEALPQKHGDIIIPKRIIDRGESLLIRLCCYNNIKPSNSDGGSLKNAALIITHNCFANDAEPVPYLLDLQLDEKNDYYVQDIEIKFDIPGNTKIEYYVNEQKFTRMIAVLDKGYLTVIPWVGTNFPLIDDEIHKYDIPGDTWMISCGINGKPENIIDRWRPYLENYYKYGDRTICFFNAKEIIPNIPNDNLYELDPSIQERGIKQLDRLMHLLGYEGMELAASYTPDDVAVKILESIGVKALTSLCAWQNWKDGDWGINHCGVSNQPYYPAQDDFRRAGEKRDIMCFTMGTASCNRNYSIMALDGCPTNIITSHRYRRDSRIMHHNIQRFYDTFDGYINDAKNNDQILTVTVALENFLGFEDWRASNELAVKFMVRRASKEKIVFTSAADITDYYKTHDMNLQAAYYFQPDYYYGYHTNDLPGKIEDRIEAVTENYLAVVRKGQGLPLYFYDYTTPWNSSNFENIKRSSWGGVNPDTCDHRESQPTQVDRSDMSINSNVCDNTVVIDIHSESTKKRMVTGIFDIPYEYNCVVTSDKADVNIKKVQDLWTKNTHLFVDLGEIVEGDSKVKLKICGTNRIPVNAETIHNPIAAMWFDDHAYIRILDKNDSVSVKIKAPNGAFVQYLNGIKQYAENGILSFKVNTRWDDETLILKNYPREAFELSLNSAEIEFIKDI